MQKIPSPPECRQKSIGILLVLGSVLILPVLMWIDWQARGIHIYFAPGGAARSATLPINQPGKSVRILLDGEGALSLAEVEVFGKPHASTDKPQNITPLMPVSQSSTVGIQTVDIGILEIPPNQLYNIPGVPFPIYAVDGKKDGVASQTRAEKNPWWQIDFDRLYDIQKILVWSRAGEHKKELGGYVVLVMNPPYAADDLLLTQVAGRHVFIPFRSWLFVVPFAMLLAGSLFLGGKWIAAWVNDKTRSVLFIILIGLTFALLFWQGIRLGMLDVNGAEYPHSYTNIATAITRLYYGRGGYVYYCDVADALDADYFTNRRGFDNQAIARAAALQNIDTSKICYGFKNPEVYGKSERSEFLGFPGDDKGGVDFVTLAFLLFGAKLESLYYFWFLLFAISLTVYVAAYRTSWQKLMLVFFLLLSLYAVFFMFPTNLRYSSIHAQRNTSMLAMIAYLHIILAMLEKKPLTAGKLLAVLVQVFCVAFCYNIRSSIEILAGILLFGTYAFLRSLLDVRKSSTSLSGGMRSERLVFALRLVLKRIYPLVLLGVALAAVNVYQNKAYDQYYTTKGVTRHFTWHSMATGLCFSREIISSYSAAIPGIETMTCSDDLAESLVRYYRSSRSKPPLESRHYSPREYESDARRMMLDLIYQHPLAYIKQVSNDMPTMLLKSFAYNLGFYQDTFYPLLSFEKPRRDRWGLYYDPIRPDILLLLYLALVVAFFNNKDLGGVTENLVVSALTLALTIPSLLVVRPMPHLMGSVLLCLSLFGFTLLAWMVATLCSGAQLDLRRIGNAFSAIWKERHNRCAALLILGGVLSLPALMWMNWQMRGIHVYPVAGGSARSTLSAINQPGRSVRILLNGMNALNLAEVEVYGSARNNPAGSANLALQKAAAQSSTAKAPSPVLGVPPVMPLTWDGSFPVAAFAVDGDVDGSDRFSQTEAEKNAWWQVDLGASYDIHSVKIWNRSGNEKKRLRDFFVLITNSPYAADNLLLINGFGRKFFLPTDAWLFTLPVALILAGVVVALGRHRTERWVNDRTRPALIIALILVALALLFWRGVRLGMLDVSATEYPHSYTNIATAITRLFYGRGGYVYYCDVGDALDADYFTNRRGFDNQAIARAAALQNVDTSKVCYGFKNPDVYGKSDRSEILGFPGDDKGGADFVLLAFMLFGAKLESLYYFWFLLLAASLTVYLAAFRHSWQRLLTVLFVLMAIYVMLFAFPGNIRFNSIHAQRNFNILAMIAYLHLAFVILESKPFSLPNLVAILFQTGVLVFCYHIRSSPDIPAALLFFTIWAVFRSYVAYRKARSKVETPHQDGGNLYLPAMLWSRVYPVCILLAGLVGVSLYQNLSFDRYYTTQGVVRHFTAHSMITGMCYSPAIIEDYAKDIPGLKETLCSDRMAELFVNHFRASIGKPPIHSRHDAPREYEADAKRTVMQIITTHPLEYMNHTLSTKPVFLFSEIAYLLGYYPENPQPPYVHLLLGDEKPYRDRWDLYVNLLRPEMIILFYLTLTIVILNNRNVEGTGESVVASLVILMMSVPPLLLVRPVSHLMGIMMTNLIFFVYTFASWLILNIYSIWQALCIRQSQVYGRIKTSPEQ